jgi:UDP-N-acetylmuramoyl-L-alanyl-D-glutamate--2,6-diaminopimelate ligase
MKALHDILYHVHLTASGGDMTVSVTGLAFDSRKVKPGFVFIAVRGTNTDGHDFIQEAIKAGCVAVVAEQLSAANLPVSWVTVADSTTALGLIASNFYDHPSSKLKLVGVTGTNGKTTVTTLLYKLFSGLGYSSGMLSTVVNKIVDKEIPSTHTTPDPISINEFLLEMCHAGCTHCFMEVSSHAVVQGRIAGLQFAGAIFTNLTHDHLDYHGTFDNYIRAKKGFFDGLNAAAFALVNADDKRSAVMLQNCVAKKYAYSLSRMADFNAKIISNTIEGLELEVDGRQVWFRLVGDFNAYNLLSVYAAAMLLGEPHDRVLTVLSSLTGADGRFELVMPGFRFTAIVDYAHTPDALKNVLETISGFRKSDEQIISVVGCGGDRDRSKRPLMAAIACKYSDKVVLTSDNPRSENPVAILEEMKLGILPTDQKKVLVQADRGEAIRTACMLAGTHDIVLVAGKGHEKYQEIAGVKYPFDDKDVLEQVMKNFA